VRGSFTWDFFLACEISSLPVFFGMAGLGEGGSSVLRAGFWRMLGFVHIISWCWCKVVDLFFFELLFF
jgi:hypothetical protein